MINKDYEHIKLMLDFARRVKRRIAEVSVDQFLENDDLQDMVLYAMGQIGENANAVSEAVRNIHHEVLWKPIIGIRNRVFHSYGDVDMSIVYETAVDHIPELIKELTKILGED
ncbi:MAG: DUF86 domain-containing protein [Oscillospiraceae bacterium]|nr:DUF86 domain-containing protein [Oscillospiraceae bacterium]